MVHMPAFDAEDEDESETEEDVFVSDLDDDAPLNRESIDDYVIYAEPWGNIVEDEGFYEDEDKDPEDPATIGLWVRYDNGVKFPIISYQDGTIMRASADPEFADSPPEPISDLAYEQLGFHVVRLVKEGSYVLHDFWAFLPDDMDDSEVWMIYQVLQTLAQGKMPFEIEELMRRGIEASAKAVEADEIADAFGGTDDE